MTRGARVPAAVLVVAAALAVHETRYLTGYGHDAGAALAGPGHGHLPVAVALVTLALAASAFAFAAALMRRRRAGAAPEAPGRGGALRPGFTATWLRAATAVLVVYAGQEALEGALAAGHHDGLSALLGRGGWTALPLALGGGAVVALVLGGAHRAIAAVSRRLPRVRARGSGAARRRPAAVDLSRPAALALGRAGRAPPLLS